MRLLSLLGPLLLWRGGGVGVLFGNLGTGRMPIDGKFRAGFGSAVYFDVL